MSSSVHFLYALLCLVVMAMTAPAPQMEDVDPADPEVQACASFALESFNVFNQDPYHYTITKIHSVRKEHIGAGQYDMDVEVRATQCKDQAPCAKDNATEAKVFRCRFVVLTAPWRNQRTLIKSTCTPVSQK